MEVTIPTQHDVKVLRMVERRLHIRTQNVTQRDLLRHVYESALNDPYVEGKVLSVEVDGATYSVEEIRRIVHADV